jgi:hypothetical protein
MAATQTAEPARALQTLVGSAARVSSGVVAPTLAPSPMRPTSVGRIDDGDQAPVLASTHGIPALIT